MLLSAAEAAVICIASAAALGFGAVLAGFVLMRFGCCNGSLGGLADDNRRGRRRRDRDAAGLQGSSSSGDAAAEREWKGIPLNSRPPRLTPEQEIVRDKAMDKYRRRQARQERRQQRQAARAARLANAREGGGGREDPVSEVEDFDDGSSMTSRSTMKSAATTVRTTSTAAYGHGAYLLAPPGTYAVPGEDCDGEGVPEDCRSSRSGGSRRSSGTARSRASQGTVASIKSHLRHRQRQRLRRREEQQQVELFNQWAHAQMASSSELSPSSHASSAAESLHGDEEAGTGAAARRHTHGHHGNARGRAQRFRSTSVASSAPRPPEEVLGDNHVAYPFLAGGAPATYIDAGEPLAASTYMSGVMPAEGASATAAVPATSEVHVTRAGSGDAPEPAQLRRHRRTWKDVEHNVALSGFFNSPTNNGSMGGFDFATPRNGGGYVDDEAPAPFLQSPAQPPHYATESHEPVNRD